MTPQPVEPDPNTFGAPDTIVAIATPPGRGGIGIVRLSGTEAVSIACRLLGVAEAPEAGRPRLHWLRDDGRPVDQVMLTVARAPRSYTGEDTAELAAHGSPVVLGFLVERALAAGARVAEAGEFSRRSFLNGRLDLTAAEAVHDLIAAQTLAQARTAARQMGGALALRLRPIKEKLLDLVASLEAGMDFASGELDDVHTLPAADIQAVVEQMQVDLDALLKSYRAGQIGRTGARLALIGRPNAGKSSLFNALLGRSRAIVTAAAGTTRDTLEEAVDLDGIPLRLVDTAGLRGEDEASSLDEAEAMGMERSLVSAADADMVLLVADATQPLHPEDLARLAALKGRPHLLVRTKIDLVAAERRGELERCSRSSTAGVATAVLLTSASTGEGLAQLREELLRQLRGDAEQGEAALNTFRHRDAVAAAVVALERASALNRGGEPHEVLLLELHAALKSLDELTGITTTDDILARVFSAFCIGK